MPELRKENRYRANPMKHCPRCNRDLPLSEFGICRARRDGLNLYDKHCIREKIRISRQLKREMKAAQNAVGVVRKPNIRSSDRAWVRRVHEPAERVLRAL